MSIDFSDFIESLSEDPFEEVPVDVRTFVHDKRYLGLPELSEIQYALVEYMSQIYKEEDLKRFLPNANEHYKRFTKKEVILQLGKGSGKDFTSTVGVSYLVYKLLCLKDPARYFNKPPGDAIDIINVAINAQQAKNVFFKGFKYKIEHSPWFRGKYDPKADLIEFDKSITVYSGHSERESHEGLNLILAVLDEISGFNMEISSGNDQGKTAENTYKAYRGSVDSRFSDIGKVILLSFPRYKGDFITKRYDAVVAEKDVVVRSHTFVINDELDANDPNNQFTIEWEEDHIRAYYLPHIHAIKRPTWDVNPTKSIEDFKAAFFTDPADALMRFACMPPATTDDTFFRQHEKIEDMMKFVNPIDHRTKQLFQSFLPDPTKSYYVHADLAQTSDKCAVAIAHVEKWVKTAMIMGVEHVSPFVVVDAIVWWEPKKEGIVDLNEVRKWITNLRNVGFNIKLVTFDRWNSVDIQTNLKSVGIKTEILSVAKKHYDDLAALVYEQRILTPKIELLYDELINLKVMPNGKIDHPRKKSKDLSDALCGAVINALTHTPKNINREIEVHTWTRPQKEVRPDTINPPKMPDEIRDFLSNYRLV